MPLSLTPDDDQIVTKPLLSLSPDNNENHSPDFQDTQATKLHMALGAQSPGLPDVKAAVSSGQSDIYKQALATKEALDTQQTRNNIVSSILQSDPKDVNPMLIQTVQGLTQAQTQDPDLSDVIERNYSKLYTDTLGTMLGNGVVSSAMSANPAQTLELLNRTQTQVYKQNYASSLMDQTNQNVQDQSWLGAGIHAAEGWVPGYSEYQQHSVVPVPDASILPGSNLQQQYSYLWGLSNAKDFKQTIDKAMASFSNPYQAQQWLQGFFHYGTLDASGSDMNAGLDVASILPLGTLSKALKAGISVSALNPMTKLPAIEAAVGMHGEAAVANTIDELRAGPSVFFGDVPQAKNVEATIPSIAAPDKFLSGSDNLPAAAQNRLKEALVSRSDLAKEFLAANQIDRAAPEELANYKNQLFDQFTHDNPSIKNSVIDVELPDQPDMGNVYNAKVILGNRDGSLFQTEKAAQSYFNRYVGGTNDYQIVQKGQGFQIEINRAVDETKFKDYDLATSQQTPNSLANQNLGLVRSPDYLLSQQSNLARAVGTTTHEKLSEIMSHLTEPIRNLSKSERGNLEEFLDGRRNVDTELSNLGEFQQAYFERFHQMPTEKQIDAWGAYKQSNDLDYATRNLDWYKQKNVQGRENLTVNVNDKIPTGVRPFERTFEGKVLDDLPYGNPQPFTYSILKDNELSSPRWSMGLRDGSASREEIKRLIEQEGYKVLQVADQQFRVGEGRAGYIIAKDFERDRIGLQNIDKHPATADSGHKAYKYPYYIKQGMISQGDHPTYYGDRSFFNFRSEKEANDFLQVLERARESHLAGQSDWQNILRDEAPIVGPERWESMVNSKKIDLSRPFAVTRRGVRTIDTGAYKDIPNVFDMQKSTHNMDNEITGRYGGERDNQDMRQIMSEGDLEFEMQPAPLLSPFATLRQSASNLIQTRVFNDYSMMTRQNFMREFGSILKGTPEEQRASGLSILTNPEFKAGADPRQVALAKNVSRSYNNFLNIGTAVDHKIEAYKEKLLENIIPKISNRGVQNWVEDRYLSRVKDPGAFMRSAAFHMKLGLFNVQQFFMQANQMVNIAAIGGRQGIRGSLMYPLLRWAMATQDEKVLGRLGQIAERTGLANADHFLEGISMLKRSGWNDIGGDLSYLDTLKSPSLTSSPSFNGGRKILSWGRTPFNEGERMTRLSGYMTAYLEQKDLKGGAALGRRDAADILYRAKTLTGNMQRESNAAWQKGYAAVLTQFFGYQARLTEQMLGKKLTGAEKTRLFVTYAGLYGMPVAAGTTLGVLPLHQMAQDYLNSQGVDTSSPEADLFVNGLSGAMQSYMTGREYNFSSRFGPEGLSTFNDFLRGDKSFFDMMLGASGGVALDTLHDSFPIFKAMRSEFSNDPDNYYPMQASDFLKPLRDISSVDSLAKLYQVWNFGSYLSKSGTNITQMDLPDGIVQALTGMTPERVEDSFSKARVVGDLKDWEKSQQKELMQEYRQAMKMDDGPEREALMRAIRAKGQLVFGSDFNKATQTWRYATEQQPMTDNMLDQYNKMMVRKGVK